MPQVNQRQRVLVTEEAHDGVHYAAHNKCYDQVRDGSTDRFVGAGIFDQVRDGSTDQFIAAGVLTMFVTAVLTDLLGLEYLPGT